MPPLPVHLGAEGHRQGREAQAELAPRYAIPTMATQYDAKEPLSNYRGVAELTVLAGLQISDVGKKNPKGKRS